MISSGYMLIVNLCFRVSKMYGPLNFDVIFVGLCTKTYGR